MSKKRTTTQYDARLFVKTSQIYTVATNEGLRREIKSLANRQPEKKEEHLKMFGA